jgi:hypothetical protein
MPLKPSLSHQHIPRPYPVRAVEHTAAVDKSNRRATIPGKKKLQRLMFGDAPLEFNWFAPTGMVPREPML